MASPHAQPVFDLKSLLPPAHEHTLPSNGFYEGVNTKTVNVRSLTVKEMKHLTTTGRFDQKVFDAQISSCVSESIDISKLLVQDYNYLVYLVRLYSNGNVGHGAMTCSGCKRQFNFEFDMTQDVHVDFLEEPLPLSRTIALPRFKSALGFDVTVDVKPLTRADYAKLDRAIKQSIDTAARLNQPVSTFPLIELLKVHITQISGFPTPVPKEQLLDYLDQSEADLIVRAYPEDEFGVNGQANITCPVCSTEQKYSIPFSNQFFL